MRVLVVDDHEVVRRGIRFLLLAHDIEVCGEAVDGLDAILKAQELKPDVITMDITMPKLGGLEATREIRRILPDAKVLVLSQHDTPRTVKEALHAGASGYIIKSAVAENIAVALKQIWHGGTFFDPAVFASDVGTAATREVLDLVANHMAAAVTRCSRDLRYLWASRGYAEWIGVPLRDIVGHSIQEVLGTEAFQTLTPHFARVLAGEKVEYEQKTKFKGIGPRWIWATYTPTLDSFGSADGWVAVVRDVTDRKHIEEALRESQSLLAAEGAALVKLNEVSSRLWGTRTLRDGLNEMLDAAIELMSSDKGNVQLLEPGRNVLSIVAQHGFQQDFLDLFREVSAEDESACGRALRYLKPVVIEDIEGDEDYTAFRAVARSSGYRAVASVPLIGSDGSPLGVLSTHFRSVRRPSEESMRRLVLYARQAAGFIERCRFEAELSAARKELRQNVD